jgi:hypothetical protein
VLLFRNLFLSLFFVFAVGFALVQAEESKGPRGPKITSVQAHHNATEGLISMLNIEVDLSPKIRTACI